MDENARHKAMLWLLAGLGIAAFIAAMMYDAKAMDDGGRIDNAIVFVADISTSMNAEEIAIVRESHAAAIVSHEVITAIEAGAFQRSAFSYVEFADRAEVIVGWTIVDGAESAAYFAQAILEPRGGLGSSTGIGSGLVVAEGLLRSLPWEALFLTVDVVGDGKNNHSVPPALPRQMILDMGATINGLPMEIKSAESGLSDWYAENIIGGPRAFLLPLNRIEDMPMTLRRKLVLELW